MHKILLIAYYFPPYQGVGAFRAAGFHRYLREFGWSTHVVTATPRKSELDADESVTYIPEPEGNAMSKLIPLRDNSWMWSSAVKRQLSQIIEREKPEVVLITGGPFLYFELAFWIREEFGIPYILDFRDPFINPIYGRRFIRNAIAKRLERRWVSKAAAILIPIEQMRPYVSVPDYIPVYVIENGFDDTALEKIINLPQPDFIEKRKNGFYLVYAGKFLNGYRDPLNLLRTLKAYEQYNIPKSELVYVGPSSIEIKRILHKEKYPLIEMGPRDYLDTIRLIKVCDIGVVISTGALFEATTKVYDYIALNKPILAIGAPAGGGIQSILHRYGRYEICENREDDIARAIKVLLDKKSFYPPLTEEKLRQFGRKYQAMKLAEILYQVVGKSKTKGVKK
ncbi:MAG: glycosyltransferase [Moorellaceae bacterium]